MLYNFLLTFIRFIFRLINGREIVQGLEIDAFSQERIDKTLAELQAEKDGVKDLL